MDMRKRTGVLALLILAAVMLTAAPGCNLFGVLLNNVSPGDILNLGQLGQVDLAGSRNLFIPEWPDYDKDPFCQIPGFCGANIFYPTSSAPDVGEPISTCGG